MANRRKEGCNSGRQTGRMQLTKCIQQNKDNLKCVCKAALHKKKEINMHTLDLLITY